MAGRFPLYTDADVHGPLIKALKQAGWDIVRAIEALPEGADDLPHFERAIALSRVLVTSDEDKDRRGLRRARRTRQSLRPLPDRPHQAETLKGSRRP